MPLDLQDTQPTRTVLARYRDNHVLVETIRAALEPALDLVGPVVRFHMARSLIPWRHIVRITRLEHQQRVCRHLLPLLPLEREDQARRDTRWLVVDLYPLGTPTLLCRQRPVLSRMECLDRVLFLSQEDRDHSKCTISSLLLVHLGICIRIYTLCIQDSLRLRLMVPFTHLTLPWAGPSRIL